jgi:hypothetical protein
LVDDEIGGIEGGCREEEKWLVVSNGSCGGSCGSRKEEKEEEKESECRKKVCFAKTLRICSSPSLLRALSLAVSLVSL